MNDSTYAVKMYARRQKQEMDRLITIHRDKDVSFCMTDNKKPEYNKLFLRKQVIIYEKA